MDDKMPKIENLEALTAAAKTAAAGVDDAFWAAVDSELSSKDEARKISVAPRVTVRGE